MQTVLVLNDVSMADTISEDSARLVNNVPGVGKICGIS